MAETPAHIRYQLFHRTVSALLEADRFNARYAMMIIHSFSPDKAWFEDYQAFLDLFSVLSSEGELVELPVPGSIKLYSGWVSGKLRKLSPSFDG